MINALQQINDTQEQDGGTDFTDIASLHQEGKLQKSKQASCLCETHSFAHKSSTMLPKMLPTSYSPSRIVAFLRRPQESAAGWTNNDRHVSLIPPFMQQEKEQASRRRAALVQEDSGVLPKNLLHCRLHLACHVPVHFRAAFQQATLQTHGSLDRSKRYVEVKHPGIKRHVIIRNNGMSLLLTRRNLSNTTHNVIARSIEYRDDSDDSEEDYADNTEVFCPKDAFSWMFGGYPSV